VSADAPAALLEMLRPRPYVRPEVPAGVALVEGHGYAMAAVVGELERMREAPAGTRNETAFRVGCRLYELTLAPWARLDGEQIEAAFLDACEQANGDGQFTYGEAWSVWLKVQRHVREPADRPTPEGVGEVVGWERLPAGLADFLAQLRSSGAAVSDNDQGLAVPADPFEDAVSLEMWRQAVRSEASRRLATAGVGRRDFEAETLDDEGLAAIPAPVPLVDGWLYQDTLARINGPSGHGKSFVAMEMAACVANGRRWHGCKVAGGSVLYVVAEGAAGANARLQAWRTRAGLERHNVRVIASPVQTGGPEWGDFIAWCVQLGPALIVLDTQARVTEGLDENAAEDMGRAVGAWEALRAVTGACVLLVHHRGLRGEHGRGSSAIRGAMSTELDVSKVGLTICVKTTKQKDAAEAPPILLTMNAFAGSMVLVANDDAIELEDGTRFVAPAISLSKAELRALAIISVLQETAASGETHARLRTRAFERADFGTTPGSRTGAFSRAWAWLVERGRIAKAQGREAFYFIDIEGLEDIAMNPDKKVQGGPEHYEGD
jgi:hypothetical protein